MMKILYYLPYVLAIVIITIAGYQLYNNMTTEYYYPSYCQWEYSDDSTIIYRIAKQESAIDHYGQWMWYVMWFYIPIYIFITWPLWAIFLTTILFLYLFMRLIGIDLIFEYTHGSQHTS